MLPFSLLGCCCCDFSEFILDDTIGADSTGIVVVVVVLAIVDSGKIDVMMVDVLIEDVDTVVVTVVEVVDVVLEVPSCGSRLMCSLQPLTPVVPIVIRTRVRMIGNLDWRIGILNVKGRRSY